MTKRLAPFDVRRNRLRRQFATLTGQLENLSTVATQGQGIYPTLKRYQTLARRLERALQQMASTARTMAQHAARK